MSFVSPINPDHAIQVLGVLVQTYASILAIVGAFYVFIIERVRTEKTSS